MNNTETRKLEYFLADSFREGNMSRELRLSRKEIEYLKKKYPRVTLTRIDLPDYANDRDWYEVRFSV